MNYNCYRYICGATSRSCNYIENIPFSYWPKLNVLWIKWFLNHKYAYVKMNKSTDKYVIKCVHNFISIY